jgi:hypothetical protein
MMQSWRVIKNDEKILMQTFALNRALCKSKYRVIENDYQDQFKNRIFEMLARD